MKLQEAQQLRMIAESNLEELKRELQESKERVIAVYGGKLFKLPIRFPG